MATRPIAENKERGYMLIMFPVTLSPNDAYPARPTAVYSTIAEPIDDEMIDRADFGLLSRSSLTIENMFWWHVNPNTTTGSEASTLLVLCGSILIGPRSEDVSPTTR